MAIEDLPVFIDGRRLGFYHNLAHYVVIGPIVLLTAIALVYNILVGFATWWVYNNIAWTNKRVKFMRLQSKETLEEYAANQDVEAQHLKLSGDHLHTSIWEEIFVINIKLANYLLGHCVELKDLGDYVVLKIHDFVVFLPLAVVFIQLCEVVVCAVVLVILVDNSFMEVIHTCTSNNETYDCYEANNFNMSSLPINCAKLSVDIEVICFHLKFNPVFAVAVAGGILKIVPAVAFTLTMYIYLKLYNAIHSNITMKYSKIISIAIAEVVLIGGGITVVVTVTQVNELNTLLIATVNPLDQMRNAFFLGAYFLLGCFMWCIYPQSTSVIRFHDSNWKKEVTTLRQKEVARRKSQQAKFSKREASSLLK